MRKEKKKRKGKKKDADNKSEIRGARIRGMRAHHVIGDRISSVCACAKGGRVARMRVYASDESRAKTFKKIREVWWRWRKFAYSIVLYSVPSMRYKRNDDDMHNKQLLTGYR